MHARRVTSYIRKAGMLGYIASYASDVLCACMQVPLIILLLSSLLQLVFSDNNNIPLPHPHDMKKEINCTNDTICNISLVVAPMMSMTYYNITDTHADLKGYKAYYYQISEIDYELDFFDRSKNMNISRSMLKEPITVDGEFRSIITINYQMPGPTIIVNENQELSITVHNDLLNGEGISIHWHGMHQKGKYEMDGVAHITQEPIPAHKSFTYKFTASPAGTHWYHAHSGTHRTEGLYGALIVQDAYQKELYDKDLPKEHTLLLMDWQKEASIDLFHQIRSSLGFTKTTYACKTQPTTRDPSYCYCDASREKEGYQNYSDSEPESVDYTQVGPIPFWSGIINDKGRHYDEQGRHNGADLNVFTVTHGKRYRFRLIGAQALYAYKFSIQDHVLTVIATDGNHIESIKDVHYVIVNSGERYDIVVNANQNQTRNYWILAETLENPINDMGNLNEGFHNRVHFHRAEAVLHYENASDPKTFYQTKPVMTWDNTCIRNYVNCPFSTEEQLLPVPLPASPTMNCTNVDQFVSLYIDNITSKLIYDPNITMFYNFGFDGEITSRGSSVDGINFRLPANLPSTQEFDSACPGRGCDHNDINHCACTQVINITKGQCVQLVVTNHFGKNGNNRNPESSHPIHLHGHTFYVVKIGYPSYSTSDSSLLKRKYYGQNEDVTCRKIPDDNTHNSTCEWFITVDDKNGQRVQEVMWANNTNPNFESKAYAAKDTVIVPFGGYVVIRFIADNPGWWFFHCHIEIHQLEGMAALIQELDPQSTTPESDKGKFYNTYTQC